MPAKVCVEPSERFTIWSATMLAVVFARWPLTISGPAPWFSTALFIPRR